MFSCRGSETQVVFKARLSYTGPVGTYSANDLVIFFSSWVMSGRSLSLTVTGTVFTVDPTCPAELESLTAEDCVNPNSPVSDTLNTNIIWTCALGGSVVIVMIIIIVVISIWCAHRKKKLKLSR